MAKANELTDATIPFISLVRKGANGDPLRILKHDASGTGLDLAAQASAVLATVAMKNGNGEEPNIIFFSARDEEAAAALEEVLTVLGLKTETTQTDHGLVFMQADKVPADVIMVELEPGVHMAVAGLNTKKADLYGCSGEEATSFENVLGTEGAVPMAGVILEALGTTVRASLRMAKTSQEAKQNVGGALRGAAAYLERVIDAIPMIAFKIEQEMAELEVVEKPKDGEDPAKKGDTEGDKPKDGDKPAEGEGDKKPAEGEGAQKSDTSAGGEGDKKKPEGEGDKPATEQKSAGAVDTDAIIAAVTKAVEGKLEPLQKTVDAVQQRLEKAEGSISGKLIGGRSGDEPSRAKKGDQPASGTGDFSFDTGMGRKP